MTAYETLGPLDPQGRQGHLDPLGSLDPLGPLGRFAPKPRQPKKSELLQSEMLCGARLHEANDLSFRERTKRISDAPSASPVLRPWAPSL